MESWTEWRGMSWLVAKSSACPKTFSKSVTCQAMFTSGHQRYVFFFFFFFGWSGKWKLSVTVTCLCIMNYPQIWSLKQQTFIITISSDQDLKGSWTSRSWLGLKSSCEWGYHHPTTWPKLTTHFCNGFLPPCSAPGQTVLARGLVPSHMAPCREAGESSWRGIKFPPK